MTSQTPRGMVHTVRGQVPADDLGVVAVHEGLVSVLPGAEFAHDIEIDLDRLRERLESGELEVRDERLGAR